MKQYTMLQILYLNENQLKAFIGENVIIVII